MLWFALILLFLCDESHLRKGSFTRRSCCDLLWFYYFCVMNHIFRHAVRYCLIVVICFDFIIFVWWITSVGVRCLAGSGCDLLWFYYFCVMNHIADVDFLSHTLLWFALILLFLCDESHLAKMCDQLRGGCDLLWFYYFCVMNHITIVVIF